MEIDPESIDVKFNAERARVIGALRRIADRLERLPVSLVSEPLIALTGLIERFERTAEPLLHGGQR